MFEIVGISDRFDPRLTEFRKKVCIENGAREDYLDSDLGREETEQYFKTLDEDAVFEEIWKYGNNKWQRTNFARIECVLHQGKIIGISGCRRYTHNMLRVGMHHYTLKSFRKEYRNILFSKHGYFKHHIQYARESGDIDYLFVTIFPHNPKLEALVKNIAHRKVSPDGGKQGLHFVENLIFLEKPIQFHDVDQYFFLYPLKEWTGLPEIPRPL